MPLTEADLEKLKARGILPLLAVLASLFRVTNDDGATLLGRKDRKNYAGIVIPKYWPGDTNPRSYTVRRDEPDREAKSDGTTRELNKYMTEGGKPNQLYFAPGVTLADLSDNKTPAIILEGQFKVLAFEQYRQDRGLSFLPIGLTGVYGYRGKIGKVDAPNGGKQDLYGLINDFEFITLQGRTVYVCYDTNVHTNDNVKWAEKNLVKILRNRGAKVVVVRLPKDLLALGINGIDDVLGQPDLGADYVTKLIAQSETHNIEEQEAKKRKFDDLDFAIAFANLHPELRYDEDAKLWRQWQGTHWQPYHRIEELKSLICQVVREASPDTAISDKKVSSIAGLARAKCRQDFQHRTNKLINFQNGTLDISTNEMSSHNPDDGLCNVVPYAYTTDAPCFPTIQAFLETAIPDKTARYAFMSHCGLSLRSDNRMHQALVLMGATRGGKSTAEALANLVTGSSLEDAFNFAGSSLFDRGSEGKKARATWNDRKLVGLDEMPKEAFKNEETLKAMTAHSGIEMRGLFKDEQVGNRWRPKLIFATNDTPILSDLSGAIRQRLLIINFPNTIASKQQDKLLLDKFIPELGSFAAACLGMAELTLRRGSYPISATMEQSFSDITLLSNPLKMFVTDNCILDSEAWLKTSDLWSAYKVFCDDAGHIPLGKNRFTASLMDMNLKLKQVRRGVSGDRGIAGIRLRVDSDPLNTSLSTDEGLDEEFLGFDNILSLLTQPTDTTDNLLTQEKIICQSININNINKIDPLLTQLTQYSNNINYREDNNSLNVDTHIDAIGKNKTAKVMSVMSVVDIEQQQVQQNQEFIDAIPTDTTNNEVSAMSEVSVSSVSELIEQGVFKQLPFKLKLPDGSQINADLEVKILRDNVRKAFSKKDKAVAQQQLNQFLASIAPYLTQSNLVATNGGNDARPTK